MAQAPDPSVTSSFVLCKFSEFRNRHQGIREGSYRNGSPKQHLEPPAFDLSHHPGSFTPPARQGTMDASTPDLSGLNSQLTDADKSELQTFLNHTRQRTDIQQRTHVLADMCFKKCITSTIKSSALDRSEESCISNCVGRFWDISKLTVQQIQNMRQ